MIEPSEKNLLLAHDRLWPEQSHNSTAYKLHQTHLWPMRYVAAMLDERDAADAQREAAVQAERAAVVAWLRDIEGRHHQRSYAKFYFGRAADAIEAGEHRKEG